MTCDMPVNIVMRVTFKVSISKYKQIFPDIFQNVTSFNQYTSIPGSNNETRT